MARRFETQYRVKRQDNLGDPEFWNRRWDDIDRRMHARELDATEIDDKVDELEALALVRLNDSLTPIITEAITRVRSVGLLFSALSASERSIAIGPATFVLSEDTRNSYVPTGWVTIVPTEDETVGMVARTLDYDRVTGELDVYADIVVGAGTHDDWWIKITGNPDLAHSTRTDNPHDVTAAQVGAYTVAEADAAITAGMNTAISTLVAGAPGALDTLNELAAALADDPNFAASMATALANRIRYDAVQSLTQAQKDQALANIGAWTTGDAKLTFKTVADPGWILMNDGSIGDASSGAIARANADCELLFTLVYNNVTDAHAPIQTSGGGATTRAAQGSAAAAWAAHCRLVLPRQLGRSIAIAGAGAGLTGRALGQYLGNETHTQSGAELASHSHPHAHGRGPDGGGSGSYFLHSNATTTTFSPGSGVTIFFPTGYDITTDTNAVGAGSSSPMDVMNPSAYWNVMIKL